MSICCVSGASPSNRTVPLMLQVPATTTRDAGDGGRGGPFSTSGGAGVGTACWLDGAADGSGVSGRVVVGPTITGRQLGDKERYSATPPTQMTTAAASFNTSARGLVLRRPRRSFP